MLSISKDSFFRNLLLVFICTVLISCNQQGQQLEPTDTPTSGEVTIVVDESYSLLFDTQIATFEALYKNAKIHVKYSPESQSINYLINDSCKVIVINRDLTTEEKKAFESKNIFPKSTKIAEDAIAFIVNNENIDTVLTIAKLKAMLSGKDTLWKQVNEQSILGNVNVVFDNTGSTNARYMKEVLDGKELGANCFAVKSNPEVIKYVNEHKNAIGIVSVNWISDRDDSISQGFLKKIKVVAIAKNEEDKAYKPYQAYIKTKEYPFCREVYMISRQTRAGLGMGFVSFVAGEKGQLMILKAGLIPSIAPVRMVEINVN